MQIARSNLSGLRDQMEAAEAAWSRSSTLENAGAPSIVATGWSRVDAALPHAGLPRATLHEWLAPPASDGARHWHPPLTLLTHLAAAALCDAARPEALLEGRAVVWIGTPAIPAPAAIPDTLLRHSLFIHPPDPDARLWAIDLALRNPAVTAVIADASGLQHAAHRRLHLAAAAGAALALLVRPDAERHAFSSAATRWQVAPRAPATTTVTNLDASRSSHVQRWDVHLLRCKGLRPTSTPLTWIIERDHATRHLRLAPDLERRSQDPRQPARTHSA